MKNRLVNARWRSNGSLQMKSNFHFREFKLCSASLHTQIAVWWHKRNFFAKFKLSATKLIKRKKSIPKKFNFYSIDSIVTSPPPTFHLLLSPASKRFVTSSSWIPVGRFIRANSKQSDDVTWVRWPCRSRFRIEETAPSSGGSFGSCCYKLIIDQFSSTPRATMTSFRDRLWRYATKIIILKIWS